MNKNASFLSSFMNFAFVELPYLMWLRRIFISSESHWIPLGILFHEISAKQICNAREVRWYAMPLTCFWNIGSPSLMLHRHRVALFAFQSLLCSFDVLDHSCASHPLSCKCSAHLGLSAIITALVVYHLTMPPSVVLLDLSLRSLKNRSSPGFFQELFSDWLCALCQHPSSLSISYELTSSWNIPFKYIRSSTFMELSCHSDLYFILCSKKLILYAQFLSQ